jgi:hypothetical protein
MLKYIMNSRQKFTAVDVGGRDKQSGGGTFIGSTLSRLLEEGKLNVPPPQALPNSNIVLQNVLMGDEAYPLKTYLLRPYPPQEEGRHINRLSQAASKVRNEFTKYFEDSGY